MKITLTTSIFAYVAEIAKYQHNFTTFMLAGVFFENRGNKSMHYDFGIIERSETFIAFIAMIVFQDVQHIILSVVVGLIFITGIIRFIRILTQEKTNE